MKFCHTNDSINCGQVYSRLSTNQLGAISNHPDGEVEVR